MVTSLRFNTRLNPTTQGKRWLKLSPKNSMKKQTDSKLK